jgi:hypothetical protein
MYLQYNLSIVLLYGYYRVPTVRELNVRGNLLKTPHVAKFFNIGFTGTVARPGGSAFNGIEDAGRYCVREFSP